MCSYDKMSKIINIFVSNFKNSYRNRNNLKHDCTFFLGNLLLKIDKPPNSPLHISLDFDKVRLDYLIALQHLDDLFLKPETREYTDDSIYRYVRKWQSVVYYKL